VPERPPTIEDVTDAGGTVSTDPDPGLGLPGTSVTVPPGTGGGEVVIVDVITDQSPPDGFEFGDQQVNITAPDATVADPLILVFELFNPVPNPLVVFKAGVQVADPCTAPGATPDPCVESITDNSPAPDTTTVVVRASTASPWNFGGPAVAAGNCKCVVNNIFPGGTVANLKFDTKPTQTAVLGAEFGAVDNAGSNSCPDETSGIPGTFFATADVHFKVVDEGLNVLLDMDTTITCINGVDNPEKFVLVFDASSCGPLGFTAGVHDITTTVTGDAGTNERIQRIRCKDAL